MAKGLDRTNTKVQYVHWRFAELGVIPKMLLVAQLKPEDRLGSLEVLESSFIAYARTLPSTSKRRQKDWIVANACKAEGTELGPNMDGILHVLLGCFYDAPIPVQGSTASYRFDSHPWQPVPQVARKLAR